MFKWMSRMFKAEEKSSSRKSPYAAIQVGFNDEQIIVQWPDKPIETVAWSSLIGVAIETTDQGPFVEDVWWHLATREKVVTFPSEASGVDEILPKLQELPTFNNERLIAAMSCAQNQMFILWDHDGRHQSP